MTARCRGIRSAAVSRRSGERLLDLEAATAGRGAARGFPTAGDPPTQLGIGPAHLTGHPSTVPIKAPLPALPIGDQHRPEVVFGPLVYRATQRMFDLPHPRSLATVTTDIRPGVASNNRRCVERNVAGGPQRQQHQGVSRGREIGYALTAVSGALPEPLRVDRHRLPEGFAAGPFVHAHAVADRPPAVPALVLVEVTAPPRVQMRRAILGRTAQVRHVVDLAGGMPLVCDLDGVIENTVHRRVVAPM